MKQLYLLFSAFVLTACSLREVKNVAPAMNEVRQGEKFRINLPEDHSTGYLWQINGDFDERFLNELGAVWHGNEKGVDFNFQARETGIATISFYKRKYTDTSENRTYIVKIINN